MDREQVRAGGVDPAEDEGGSDLALVPASEWTSVSGVSTCKGYTDGADRLAYWKSICLSIVIAVTTSGGRPVESWCKAMLLLINAVVLHVRNKEGQYFARGVVAAAQSSSKASSERAGWGGYESAAKLSWRS